MYDVRTPDWRALANQYAADICTLQLRVAELEAEVETAWERGHDEGHRAALFGKDREL